MAIMIPEKSDKQSNPAVLWQPQHWIPNKQRGVTVVIQLLHKQRILLLTRKGDFNNGLRKSLMCLLMS